MDYEKLKEVIAKQIKENGKREITGPVLQAVLMAMVDSLGEVYPHTYTDEEKAQARANIDALSNHNGEITKEKLSIEVQAILNDVANKQNISDATLATIAKTIVGAINELFNGGVKDASIATSKIEDGAITEDKLAPQSVTNAKIANTSVSEEKITDNSVSTEKLKDGAITEPKLDTDLTTKVNNNVKTVEQTLTDNEINIASKNLKFRDTYGNFFADKVSYDAVATLKVKPTRSVFGTNCTGNTFNVSCFNNVFGDSCSDNIFTNSNSSFNLIQLYSTRNSFQGNCWYNNIVYSKNCIYGTDFRGNEVTHCSDVVFNKDIQGSKFEQLENVEIKFNHVVVDGEGGIPPHKKVLKNVHIFSVRGLAPSSKFVINIPDEYLDSPRKIIITTKTYETHNPTGAIVTKDIVMYYADEVVDKQNKQDNTLATTSKEVVGAINELFNGGVKDTSIVGAKLADATVTSTKIAPRTIIGDNIQNKTIKTEQIADNAITTENIKENAVTSDKIKNESITGYKIPNETILERHLGYWAVTKNKIASGQVTLDKLASSVQNTLGKVGTNIKVLPAGTDLLSDNIEEGVYILLPTGSGTYPNFPYSMNLHPGATAILVKAGDSSIILGIDMSSSDELPLLLKRRNGGNWYGTSIYNKINSKLDASTGAVKTANLANGAVSSDKIADGAVISTKLSDFLQDKVKMVGTNVKEISYKSMGKIPNIDDITETGIYILPDGEKYNGSTYSKLPSDLRYSNIKLLIVGPTSQSGDYTRQTIIAINYSSLVGICTREAYTPTKFVNLPFSYTSIQSAIEGKIDNTSTLTDTEINNIWDNN